MAGTLGIDVAVNFKEAMEQVDLFEKKWQKIGETPLKVKVEADADSLTALQNKINGIFGADGKETFKLNIDTKSAVQSLAVLETAYKKIKFEMAKGLDISMNSNKLSSSSQVESIIKNGNVAASSMKNAQSAAQVFSKEIQNADGYYKGLAKTQATSTAQLNSSRNIADKLASAMGTATKESKANTAETTAQAQVKKTSLTELLRLTKEAYALDLKSLDMTGKQKELTQERAAAVREQLAQEKKLYEVTTGKKVDSNWEKKQQDLSAYNVAMKEAAIATREKSQADASTAKYVQEIIKLENQRHSIYKKMDNAGGNENAMLKDQVDLLALKLAKLRQYNDESNISPQQRDKINLLVQENDLKARTIQAAKEDKQVQSELKNQMKELYDIEKKISDLQAQADNGTIDGKGAAQLSGLKQELKLREDIWKATIKKAEDNGNLSDVYQKELSTLKEKYNTQLDLNDVQAKADANIKAQANSYNELKNQLKEIQTIEIQVAKLKADKEAGVLNNKGNAQLEYLEEELRTHKEIYDATKAQATGAEGLNESYQKQLSSLERIKSETVATADKQAKSEAKVKAQEAAYGELLESVSKVAKLNDDMARAGKNEANAIQKVIDKEKEHQEEIKENIRLKGLENSELDEQVSNAQQVNNVENANARSRSNAKEKDSQSYSGIYGQMFDPRRVANDAKRAFSVVLDSVGKIDAQLVDVAKVADVPTEALDKFTENLFDSATAVGKGADVYAESVARWLVTGRTLSESDDLSQISVMGSFVGNIDEEEMVKYMSVPLETYKKDMLDAKDIVNAMNEVANNHAIEMDDLGQAYSRAAQTASTAGTSFSELTGLITGANIKTRAGGEKIGTAMKAIDLNFSKISSKITKQDAERMGFYKRIGVNIKDGNGQLRSTYDILGDLSKVWDTLSSDDQAMATLYGAGKHHAPILQGIVTGWDGVVAATADAEQQVNLFDKESGSAYKEFGVQQQSVEFKLEAANNAWKELLFTLSGGREGVTSILEIVTKLLKKAKELAEDEGLRDFALTLMKVVGAGVGLTALSKAFTFLSSGVGDAFKAIGGLTKLIGGKGLIDGGGKALGFGKILTGTVIPGIGGVIAAMMLLDAAGVPVFETMGKAADWFVKKIESASTKAEKANKEFVKSQKATQKEFSEDTLLNGSFAKVDTMIKSYNDLVAAKKKANKESGATLGFTEEEYTTLRDNFNRTAEELGFDVKITMNNFEHIQGQFAELIRQKNILTSDKLDELTEKYTKKSKPKSLKKDKAAFEKKKSDKELELKLTNTSLAMTNITEDERVALEGHKKLLQEDLAQLQNFYSSKEAIEARHADQSRFETSKQYGEQISEQAVKGTLNESWGTISPEKQKSNIGAMTARLNVIKEEKSEWANVKAELDRVNQAFKDGDENAGFSEETWQKLLDANPNLEGLGSEIGMWGERTDEVLSVVNQKIEDTTKGTSSLKDKLTEFIMATPGLGKATVDEMNNAYKQGGVALIDFLGQFEESSALLGIDATFADEYKDDIIGALKNAQAQIDGWKKNQENEKIKKAIEYELYFEDTGLANTEGLSKLLGLPDVIVKKFELKDENGNVQLDKALNLYSHLEELPDEVKKTLKIDGDGPIEIETFVKELGKLDEKGREDIFMQLGIDVNSEEYKKAKEEIYQDEKEEHGYTVKINGATTGWAAAVAEVKATKIDPIWVQIKGWSSKLFGGEGKPGKKDKSIGIDESENVSNITHPNMGKSLSRSISTDIGLANRSNSVSSDASKATTSRSNSTKSYTNPRYNTENAKVSEDTWRYWSKELFKGLPLERSMADLENAIKKVGDDYDKLIPLYKQQNGLINQQIAYQNDLKNAKQGEMNSVLAQLRGKGFSTSGNKVTNLGHAKSFTGDASSEIDTLLSTWKGLYEGLDDITGQINSLKLDKWELEQTIKDAETSKEAKKIEDTLKKSEAILTKISNHTSLMSTKLGLVSDSDTELKLAITEESLNTSKLSMGELMDEFNKLSGTSTKFAENAEDIQSQLESLQSEILSNADAILQYREELNSIRISRLIDDYAKFNEVMSTNNELLTNNITNLKEGLLSGTSFSDLQSSQLMELSFDRKDALSKEYQDRLTLEAQLNAILDAYAKKNIDRQKNVANSQLQIEKDKYNEMLALQNQYTNGKTPTFNNVGGGNVDLGAVNIGGSDKDNAVYNKWLDNLRRISNSYTSQFLEMRDQYEDLLSGATTQAEKDKITNDFIIDQLKLQEKINREMIDTNKLATEEARKELENSELTTEQRQELLDAIKEYENSSVEAENAIKQAIRDRFEFEFSLMDQAKEKAAAYSEELEHLLNIADLTNLSSDKKQTLLDKIYDSKVNEYKNAKDSLDELLSQQKEFEEGSFEWKILQEQIDSVNSSMKELTVSMLEANKKVLENKLDSIGERFAKDMFDGKTLDEWTDWRDNWSTGIDKEIALEKIRGRLLEIENDTLQSRLEMLDRQEEVSKKELDYLDKQTTLLELQQKLANIEKERKVQVLQKNEDGTWGWGYEADQSELDKVKEDLDEAEKDLEDYRNEQKGEYIKDLNTILEAAKNGEYEDTDKLKEALEGLKSIYGSVLDDIPNFDGTNFDEILNAYEDYLKENSSILDSALGEGTDFDQKLDKIGNTFAESFKSVAADLGKIIADSLKEALIYAKNNGSSSDGMNYVIEKQELNFPNVTDANGLEEVFRDLPRVAEQITLGK